MELSDLKQGDILLFTSDGSFISNLITILTKSKVSHSAMVYTPDCTQVIESCTNGIGTSIIAEQYKGRTACVRRYKVDENFQPVLNAGTIYLNNHEPYNFTDMLGVGLLLIVRRSNHPTTAKQKIIVQIVNKLTASLIDYVNSRIHPGQHPMVCSQFVTQCYQDAGAAYQLQFSNLVINDNDKSNPKLSILDRVLASGKLASLKGSKQALISPVASFPSDESLLKELYDTILLEENNIELLLNDTAALSDELTQAVSNFAIAIQRVYASNIGNPDSLSALNYLKVQNMFVLPEDLFSNCTSLEDMGEIPV
jgi:hypothetical protein